MTVSCRYWYFSSYAGMFFFIPLVNRALDSFGKKEHALLCLAILVLFSILPLFGMELSADGALQRLDSFDMGFGYTPWWLLCLYIIGAFCKRYPLRWSKRTCLLLYVLSVACAWALDNFVAKKLLSPKLSWNLFVDYTSPFILLSAVALLVLFSKIKIEKKSLQKTVGFVSALSFSVYLVHVHPLVFFHLLKDKFAFLSESSPLEIVGWVIVSALLLFPCLLQGQ